VPGPDLPAGEWLGTLPSPTALSHATGGEASPQALAANVLAPQIRAYAEGGCGLIVLSDPFLAGSDKVVELVGSLGELPDEVPLALQLPFGDASSVLAELADAPVTALGIDFYATSLDAIPESYPKEIMAGVIDSRSSALEDPAEIGRFAAALSERRPAGVSLSVSGDLQFVPEAIARRKIGVLGAARAALAEAA
jgi:5-methyltetrahydropteroyltriglutamate--homocysteine methyltransferase